LAMNACHCLPQHRLALALWHLGYPDRALNVNRQALRSLD
jgi:hypothetical protein